MNAAFVVEGDKMVLELLQSNIPIQGIYALESWTQKHRSLLQSVADKVIEVNEKDLKSISNLDTPNQVLALAAVPPFEVYPSTINQFAFVLDDIQNPGNLGTIIRTADWLGMTHLFCSSTSTDAYSPKVVQASMGSLFRLQLVYTDLPTLFKRFKDVPVYGALLEGNNLFSTKFEGQGFILMGNEGQGIGDDLQSYITHPITIPKRGKAESLNVAIAASIIGAVAVLG
ncbi:MAG: RNA methyltransferase [Chitinophagales bacterium]